jgi:hypothetical protein
MAPKSDTWGRGERDFYDRFQTHSTEVDRNCEALSGDS